MNAEMCLYITGSVLPVILEFTPGELRKQPLSGGGCCKSSVGCAVRTVREA